MGGVCGARAMKKRRHNALLRRLGRGLGWLLVWLLPGAVVARVSALRCLQQRPRDLDTTGAVVEAAGILDTSEYEVLRLAFAETFGREPRADEMRRCFGRYLLAGWTPWWGDAIAREIVSLYDAGELPASRFAIQCRPGATRREVWLGILQSLLLLLVFGMLYVMFAGYEHIY